MSCIIVNYLPAFGFGRYVPETFSHYCIGGELFVFGGFPEDLQEKLEQALEESERDAAVRRWCPFQERGGDTGEHPRRS